MKNLFLVSILLLSIVVFGQTVTIKNGGAIYRIKDINSKPYYVYEYGAILSPTEVNGEWITIIKKDTLYYMHTKDVEGKVNLKQKMHPIKIGMHFVDLVSTLGPADSSADYDSAYSYDKVLTYGGTYYVFKNDILIAINSYK